MSSERRIFRNALAALSGIVALEVVAEASFPVARIDALPVAAAPPPAPPVAAPIAPDLDKLAAAILERPLFTRGRRPPPPPDLIAAAEAEKAAQQLKARLAGMVIGPAAKEALFVQEGGKPLAVKEHQDIDGWTVAAIRPDKVVLTSAFGERVLTPTPQAPPNARSGGVPGFSPPRPPRVTGVASTNIAQAPRPKPKAPLLPSAAGAKPTR